ncbi:WxL domain-containing protein [Enterococcus faecalis]|nr:WxL domain-containing protein [Enterococcus faecalis]MDN3139624.1 WxL domain-containing protein [Enterococcus faecalis]
MKSMKLTSALTVAMIAGGIGFSSISANAVENQTSTGKVTFTAGALTLDAVPTLDFGDQAITTADQVYNAKSESVATVTDLRGSSAGWNLTVKQETQLKTAQSEELQGAQLKLASGTLETESNDTATVSNGTLVPTVALKVLDASAGQGNGTFSAKWATTGATLDVPGSTTKLAKAYTADLTWTLTDAPAS